MKQNPFYELFLDLLRDIFDAENQLVQELPGIIKAAWHQDLKHALSQHLDETKNQVQRLKKIFKMLNENPTGKSCVAMQALCQEGREMIDQKLPSGVKDAGLIVCCQKVEHYEIASYGSACAFANHLDQSEETREIDFSEITNWLGESLEEEKAADETLTGLAEGGFFSEGINDEAERQENVPSSAKTRKH